MPNTKGNFIDDALEFILAHWLTLGVIFLVLLLLAASYIGFIRDTADDKYRQRLRYSAYDPVYHAEAGKDLSASPISGRRIAPGQRTAAFLYVKNVSTDTIPAFRLELKNYASEIVMFDSTCKYPRIPPDSIVMAEDEIAFAVRPGYDSPYVSFLGRVESLIKQASLVSDWLSVTPENPIMVVMPVDSDDLEPTYFVGASACGHVAKSSPNAADSLRIGLNLLNNTERLDKRVWIRVKPLMLVVRDKNTDSTRTYSFSPAIRSAQDSVGYGDMPKRTFFKPPRQFVFGLPDMSAKEIRCVYLDVYVFVSATQRKRVTIAIEPSPPTGTTTLLARRGRAAAK